MPRFNLTIEVQNVDAPSFSDAVEVLENVLLIGFEDRVEPDWFVYNDGDVMLKVQQCK